MNKFAEFILPMYDNYIKNIIVRTKINCLKEQQSKNTKVRTKINCPKEQQHSPDLDLVDIEIYKEQYFNTFKVKDKLEDKAKTTIIGIILAITLIMKATSVINTIYDKFSNLFIKWVAFILFLAAVVYMILAGLLAIKVFAKDNMVFRVDLESFASGEQFLKLKYKEYTELNELQNIIRTNSIFTTYECIRNSLFCLFIILVLVLVPK